MNYNNETQIKTGFLSRLYNSYACIVPVKINGRNKNKVMTIGYICAIFMAFILSLANNNDVNASITKSDTINYMMLENALNDENYNAVYPENTLDNVKSLFDMVNKKFSKMVEKEFSVQKGDTIISLFIRMGLDRETANRIFSQMKPVYDVRNLRAGQKISTTVLIDSEDSHFISLESIIIPESSDARIIIEKNENNEYTVTKEQDELISEVDSISGTINGALSVSMRNNGVSGKVIANFSNIFSKSVDFRRDIHNGDTFKIIYERQVTPKGDVVRTGNILYAALNLRKNKIELYRFKDSQGNVDYYNDKGLAMRKTLHRKPLAFQAARISSPFGKRRHPVLRNWRIHWGVDYAAPAGTPIYAGGDGTVLVAKYNGGYGNYIKIRHNSEYATAYGHMKSIARGIRPGVHVTQGQIIGYVGSTGRSTGPHLHYEVVQNGKRVNPLTVKAAAGNDLTGRDLANFKKQIASIKTNYQNLFAEKKSADKLAKKQ